MEKGRQGILKENVFSGWVTARGASVGTAVPNNTVMFAAQAKGFVVMLIFPNTTKGLHS